MMVGWYLDQRYGNGLRIGLPGAFPLCLGIAVFIGFLNDLVVSEVQAGDEGVARAVYDHAIGAKPYRYEDMLGFSLVLPATSGKAFGLLEQIKQNCNHKEPKEPKENIGRLCKSSGYRICKTALVLKMRAEVVTLGIPDGLSPSQLSEFFRSHGVQETQVPDEQR